MLFKILKGDSSRISTDITPLHPGWCYFTPDDGKLYIDSENDDGSGQKRTCINPESKVDPSLVKAITQAEYDSLTEEQQNNGVYLIHDSGSAGAIDITSGITQAVADGRYLQLSGGTMNGTLTIAQNKGIVFLGGSSEDTSEEIGGEEEGGEAEAYSRPDSTGRIEDDGSREEDASGGTVGEEEIGGSVAEPVKEFRIATTNEYVTELTEGDDGVVMEGAAISTSSIGLSIPTIVLGGDVYANFHRVQYLANPSSDYDAANKKYVDDRLPTGLISMWSGNTVPTGWALCDGTNGTPDLRGRFVLGQSDTHALGSTGGEETHKLTISEMPKHDHDISCTFESGNESSGVAVKREYGAWNTSDITEKTGKGTAHNNMPPYYTLAYIMKL